MTAIKTSSRLIVFKMLLGMRKKSPHGIQTIPSSTPKRPKTSPGGVKPGVPKKHNDAPVGVLVHCTPSSGKCRCTRQPCPMARCRQKKKKLWSASVKSFWLFIPWTR